MARLSAENRGKFAGSLRHISDAFEEQHARLETNDSAMKVLGDTTLRTIARELVATVLAKVTIDWTERENVRAHLRVLSEPRCSRSCGRLRSRKPSVVPCEATLKTK